MQQIISDQVDELLRDGRIEPSRSPHSAPIVLVRKKTGEMRMCVDFRQLNAHSVPDAYPLPRIHHILERLRNARYISTLDLKNGYWQIPCKFFCRSLVYLGHVISEAGIQTDPDKIAAIKGLQPPTNCKELRRCLGTIRRVGQRYFWPGMHRDVRRHVRCCETCQRFKASQLKPAGKMLTRRPEEPFTMVSADFIGPLPRSRRGNTMLLVFLDVFSK
ncbi:hypothetical protein KR084_011570, partial [Drosophila pseudotakahashii]